MKKKLTTATTPIHNSSKNRVKEYLAIPKTHSQLREFNLELKAHLEKQFPVKIAANLSKREIVKIIKSLQLGKSGRKKARRYFYNCRVAVFGRNARKPTKFKRIKKYKYSEYIESWVWTDRKNKYYKTHKRTCVACGSAKKIHLHHMVYTAFNGTEPDNNLVTLCDEHHAAFHSQYGSSGNMKASTYAFIDEVKQLLEFPKF